MYSLLPANHPKLREKSSPVQLFDETLNEIVNAMFQTMRLHNGLGLAAPQVGILKQIITMDFEPFAMINPTILTSTGTQTIREGCLSFPELFLDINRAANIVVKWVDTKNQPFTEEFSGLHAVVIQHEIDHLHGKLFIDQVSRLKLLLAKKKLSNRNKVR